MIVLTNAVQILTACCLMYRMFCTILDGVSPHSILYPSSTVFHVFLKFLNVFVMFFHGRIFSRASLNINLSLLHLLSLLWLRVPYLQHLFMYLSLSCCIRWPQLNYKYINVHGRPLQYPSIKQSSGASFMKLSWFLVSTIVIRII